MTVKEAALLLKVSNATVHALCEAGRLAFTRVSAHSIRIAEADLVAYLGGRRCLGLAVRPQRASGAPAPAPAGAIGGGQGPGWRGKGRPG